ncbi:MAG: periplasmic heavy metal sensor [Candidatus Acidiferrum sp.]
MKIAMKTGLAALALALSCGVMVAQDGPRDFTAAPGEPMMGPGGPGGGDEGFVDPDGPAGRGGARRMGRDGERGGHGRSEFGLSRMLSNPDIQQKVGVTPEQVAKIRQQETAFRKTAIQQRADLEVKQIDLRDLLAADKPDRAAIDRQLQAISTSRLAMDKSRIDFRLNMKDALTPEQREKLRQAMKERMQARRGEGRRGGPGGRGQRGPGSGKDGAAAPPAAKPGE